MRLHLSHAAALTMFAAIPALAGCDGHVSEAKAAPAPAADAPLKVTTVQASKRSVPRVVKLTGNLEANRSSDVAADASGKVAQTFVERGAFVKKGTVIARLDARSAALAAAQAKADAEAARTDADLRRTDLGRAESLHKQSAIADAELDRTRAAKESADQRVAAADARLALNAKTVGDATIRAPFDGLVAERFIDVGEYVRPETRVAAIVDIDTLRLQLSVPEAGASAVKQGQTVAFRVASDPEGEQSHAAKIRWVGPQIRRASRDLVVEAVVDNADHALRPGMFATARLAVGDDEALVIPSAAIKKDGTTRRVFVLAGDKIEERVVQVGEAVGSDIVISGGVADGEKVVAPLLPNLRDGLKAE